MSHKHHHDCCNCCSTCNPCNICNPCNNQKNCCNPCGNGIGSGIGLLGILVVLCLFRH